MAEQFHTYQGFLYLGRGINYPMALEGALKLKEISYIHAEGYPAGEMKHGPIALIDEHMPVVVIAAKGPRLRQDARARSRRSRRAAGRCIAVATRATTDQPTWRDDVICRSRTPIALLQPILAVLPLQLLAYHIAVRRGCDVDQPRNLAKSVTVE